MINHQWGKAMKTPAKLLAKCDLYEQYEQMEARGATSLEWQELAEKFLKVKASVFYKKCIKRANE